MIKNLYKETEEINLNKRKGKGKYRMAGLLKSYLCVGFPWKKDFKDPITNRIYPYTYIKDRLIKFKKDRPKYFALINKRMLNNKEEDETRFPKETREAFFCLYQSLLREKY